MRATLTQFTQKATEEVDLNSLPDELDSLKVQRYEAHLSRQFHKVLNDLKRLQAMRLMID